MAHFESELAQLRHRCAGITKVSVITPEETAKLRKDTSEMVAFCKDIRDTTQVNSTIYALL